MKAICAVAVAGAALVVGVASGAAVASTPEARTPLVCQTALTRAGDLFDLSGELLYQVRLRGDALGKEDYLKYDTEVVRVLAEMEPVEASFASAEAECRGLA